MCKRKALTPKEADNEHEKHRANINDVIQQARDAKTIHVDPIVAQQFILTTEQQASILKAIKLKSIKAYRSLKLDITEASYPVVKDDNESRGVTYRLPLNQADAKNYTKRKPMTYVLSAQKLSRLSEREDGWDVCGKESIDGQDINKMMNGIQLSGVVLVRDHDHYTGEYRGALCSDCNTSEGKITKFLPLFFYNLSGYDGHPIFLELAKRQSKHIKLDNIITKTKDVCVSFSFGCIRFLDSCRFLSSSLDGIAKSLDDDDFFHTKKWLPTSIVNDVQAIDLFREMGFNVLMIR